LWLQFALVGADEATISKSKKWVERLMAGTEAVLGSAGREPRRADLGKVDGLDLHAQYYANRTGGDFFDAVRAGSRVAFVLSDIAGRRPETDLISAHVQEVFRARAAEWFAAIDANLMEGTEMLAHAINLALVEAAKGVRFAPTIFGCYDVQLGILAYINAGGLTAVLHDSDGARELPNVSMPLGLFTHLTYEASMQAFEPGAKLLVVTKGVTESMRGKVPFGAERVLEVLQSSKDESADGVCRAVLEAAHGFEKRSREWLPFGKKVLEEDLTALAMVRSV
jgi:serine phosphatase RsbU (regulator of sigma subunit)